VTINYSVKHQHKNSSVLEGTLPSKISHRQQQSVGLFGKQNGRSNSISLVKKNPMIPGGYILGIIGKKSNFFFLLELYTW